MVNSKQVLILLADGFEDIEVVAVFDLLKRALMVPVFIACQATKKVVSACGLPISADYLLQNFSFCTTCNNYEGLFIPGGEAVSTLRSNADVLALVRVFAKHKKIIAAICAGPMVIKAAQVFDQPRLTCYPRSEIVDFLKTNDWQVIHNKDEKVVYDEQHRFLTSVSPNTAVAFALRLIALLGCVRAEEIKANIERITLLS